MKLVLIFLSTIFIITLNTNINANTIKNKNHKVTIKNSKKINTNNQDVLISKPTKPKINIISSYKDTEFTKTNTDTYFPGYHPCAAAALHTNAWR